MAPPTWSVGQVLTASDVNTWFVPLAAYKTSALGRTSTSLTNDPDLQLSLASNSFYEVCGILIYQGATGSIGLKYQFSVPAGTGGGYSVALQSGTFGLTWATTETAGQSDTAVYSGQIQGMLSTSGTAGTMALQWASGTGGSMTLGAGSYLKAVRIG